MKANITTRPGVVVVVLVTVSLLLTTMFFDAKGEEDDLGCFLLPGFFSRTGSVFHANFATIIVNRSKKSFRRGERKKF